MTDRSSRQIYLQLTANLYELASKYSRDELRAARDVARSENNALSISAIDMLLALHSGDQHKAARRSSQNVSRSPDGEYKSESADRRRVGMLKEILMSHELFANASEVAKAVPISLPLKPKESREKYVNRILVRFRGLDAAKQQEFMEGLQAFLGRTSSSSFVSRWSRAIKDL
jgi:hypothetical protein